MYRQLGFCKLKTKETTLGRGYLQKALLLDSTDVPSLEYMVLIHLANKDYDKALETQDRLIIQDTTDGFRFFEKGNIYRDKGHVFMAIKEYEKAIKKEYVGPDIYKEYGKAMIAGKWYRQGIDTLNKGVMSFGLNVDYESFDALGNAYFSIGQTDSALSCYQTSLKIYLQDEYLLMHFYKSLEMCYSKLGNTRKAEGMVQNIMNMETSSPGVS